MKVQELLIKMYTADFNWLEELEVKHYISIVDKKKFCIDVISACTDEINGFISTDKFKMNIYFNMKMLELYTNLEVENNFDKMVEQYDSLCEIGVMDNLLSLFADEYRRISDILDIVLDDLLIQNSVEAQVVRIANRIMGIIDITLNSLNNIDVKSILPDDLDELMKNFSMLK